MRRALLILLAVPALWAQAPKAADPAEAKRADIQKLMTVMDAGRIGVQAMKQAADAERKTNSEVPAEFWDAFLAEMTAEKIVAVALPVYERNLTQQEVSALLALYSTPEGRSVMQKMPKIMAECSEAGQKLGREVGAQVAERLQAEGKMGK